MRECVRGGRLLHHKSTAAMIRALPPLPARFRSGARRWAAGGAPRAQRARPVGRSADKSRAHRRKWATRSPPSLTATPSLSPLARARRGNWRLFICSCRARLSSERRSARQERGRHECAPATIQHGLQVLRHAATLVCCSTLELGSNVQCSLQHAVANLAFRHVVSHASPS